MQNATLETLASPRIPSSEEWPVLDIIFLVVPILAALRFGYCIYFRFFTGGTKGKQNLRIDEASGSGMNVRVFLDIDVGDSKPPGRVELLLFMEHYPKTAENYRALCTGEKGRGKFGKNLHYKGSYFHRIVPGFVCQGGNCTGGQSIYGYSFTDEWTNGYIEHSRPGLLSMAHAGRDTQNSQFFITLKPCRHLDGRHVVFGQVVEGMEVVRRMEQAGSRSRPQIVDCGEIGCRGPPWKDSKDV